MSSSSDEGVFEASFAWQDRVVTLSVAAKTIEVTLEALNMLLDAIENPKPDFDVTSTSVQRSNGKTTGSVIFQVKKGAAVLGTHLRRLGNHKDYDKGLVVIWNARDTPIDSISSVTV